MPLWACSALFAAPGLAVSTSSNVSTSPQALLEQIRAAFGAKHVVRVCPAAEGGKVLEGARRLLEAAPLIRSHVDLSGVSIAIDDCYEMWGSGFISIPYDFSLQVRGWAGRWCLEAGAFDCRAGTCFEMRRRASVPFRRRCVG